VFGDAAVEQGTGGGISKRYAFQYFVDVFRDFLFLIALVYLHQEACDRETAE
jgi:hypothetical protein